MCPSLALQASTSFGRASGSNGMLKGFHEPPMRASFRTAAITLATVAAATLATGCRPGPSAVKGNKPVDVVATVPVLEEVTDYQDFTGRLEAVKTVEIRARVSGYVKAINFKEGDLVRQGDLLYQIEPKPYEVEVKQTAANVKQAEADRNLQAK